MANILYKYRAFNDRTIEMLKKNQVYFASPLEFNDPFDCLAQETMLENSRESVETFLEADALKRGFSKEQIIDARERIKRDKEMVQARAESDTDFQRSIDYVKNELGIISLSSRNNSILMWAHYADCHRGFCIGFKNNLDMPEKEIKKVNYMATINKDFIFKFFMSGDNNEDQFLEEHEKMTILTKYQDWEYEDEWRVIGKKGVGIYSEGCVGEIIFGLKMPQEHRNQIRSILADKNVVFFEAVKNANDFKIDINKLDV